MAFETAASVISDVAIDLGLVSTAIANPWGSTDPSVLQLINHLERVGKDFVRAFPWSHLQTEYTFPTVDATASYALPADFNRFIDQTAWNRTQQKPMYGPLSPIEWQQEKARSATTTAQFFRIFGNLFYIHATPTGVETIAYEYISRYWVDLGGGSTPDAESPAAAADTLFFDPELLCAGLKLRFLTAKGFPSEAAKIEFDAQWSQATGADSASPVLSLSGQGGSLLRPNLPESGFGS